MRATDKRIELLPPQLNAREIRLDGVFTRDTHGRESAISGNKTT
jgi:hypothetical protein